MAPKVTLAYVELTCQNYGEILKFKNIYVYILLVMEPSFPNESF